MENRETRLADLLAASFSLVCTLLLAGSGLPAALAEAPPAGGATSAPSASPSAAPASRPASGLVKWGQAKGGLQVGLAGEANPPVGGEFDFRIALKNSSASAVKLPDASKVVGWFLVGQQEAEDKKFYTQRFYLALGMDDWPAELESGGEVLLKPVSIGSGTVYSSKFSRELLTAYVSNKITDLPSSEGRLVDVLQVGPASVRLTLLLPKDEGGTEGLNSNVVEVKVNARPLVTMTPEARKEYVADLLQQFDKDEWSAMKAHDQAVALGKDLVPDLIPAAKDKKRPKFARMWLATALADIRDPQSASALEDLLDDKEQEVVYVVCYHGAKQRSDRLDEAITKMVEKSKDNRLTAYAILGYIVFRGTAPDELMKLTLDSSDPRVRGTLSMALKNQASDFNLSRLMEFLSDTSDNVRINSARMLQQLGRKTPTVFRAMVSSLDYPGEEARQRICQVLSDMTGISNPYDPKADEATRQQTLKKWRDWVARAPKRPD